MKSRWMMGALAVPLAWGSFAAADTLEIELVTEFSGAQQPSGTLKAIFEDDGLGNVNLTLQNNLVGTEFVSGWYFNYGGTLPSPGDFDYVSESPVNSIDAVTVATSSNAFQADGDGLYDILFSFPTSGDRFQGGESLVYKIDGVSAALFNVQSAPAGGKGPFTSAAHVQGVGTSAGGSGWISGEGDLTEGGPGLVPLPPVVLGGALLMGLIARGRTRSKI